MYVSDNRFFVSHSRHSHYQGSRHSQVWFLHLRNATDADEGEYECQTSNHPHVSTISFLRVQSSYSLIMGPSERVVAAGSELRLVCSFKNSSKELLYLFWYQYTKMINYDKSRGVTVSTGNDLSNLTIASVTSSHAGNYTCEPSNAAPSSVIVHVAEENGDPGPFNLGTNAGGSDLASAGDGSDPASGTARGEGVTGAKAPVRQLGVISASSTSPQSLSESSLSAVLSLVVLIWGILDSSG